MLSARAVLALPYFGAAAAVSPGGRILNVKIDTFWPGSKGPAT
jgi:hypothetical protein